MAANRHDKRHRLMIDFENASNLAEFVGLMRKRGLLPEHLAPVSVISTDFAAATGVGRRDTYIVREAADADGVLRNRLTVIKPRQEVVV